ncbi:hypothetical protein Tco_1312378 [Tanacetum coccineum]
MHTSSSWIRKSSELTLKYFVRSSRSVPYSITKILLNLLSIKKWFHLSRISGTLASMICYLRSIQIKRTSLREHLLLSSIEQTLVLEEEPAKKPKRAKHPEPAKKSAPAKKDVSFKKPSRKQLTGVQIRDTLDVFVSKKKAPTTTNRSKGIDLLSKAALLEDVQMKKVPDELQDKTTGTNEGTSIIPRAPDVPKDQSESENESWGESVDNDDSNKDDNDDDGNNDASDDERTESDDDQNDDDNEEEYEDEYVRTPINYESTDDENEHMNAEEYDCINEELYKDVYIKLKDVEHGEEGKGYAEKTDVGHDDVTQETTYDQVEDDTHVTVIVAYTEVPLQSSSISSDFATQYLNLDNVPPTNNEIISMMNVDVRHEEPSNQTTSLLTIPVTVIPQTLKAVATTIPPHIPPVTPLP